MEETQMTFYPTYGSQDKAGTWQIPIRMWSHKDRSVIDHLLALAINHGANERRNFLSRIADTIAENLSTEGDRFTITFDDDPEKKPYEVTLRTGNPLTDPGGLIGNITVQANGWLNGTRDKWLNYHAVSDRVSGQGQVRLIGAEGCSVISDIDDTIKITEIPAGLEIVLRNTLFRDFVAVPEAAQIYLGLCRDLQNASFHYVSGGPWHLYGPLHDFLIGQEGFPAGTFHLKTIATNLLNPMTLDKLKSLVEDGFNLKKGSEQATFDQKIAQITEIMTEFRSRKFILIGDSGERDPDVYREIRRKFVGQVQEIRIRDVVNAETLKPGWLDGMTVRHAPTIVPGISTLS